MSSRSGSSNAASEIMLYTYARSMCESHLRTNMCKRYAIVGRGWFMGKMRMHEQDAKFRVRAHIMAGIFIISRV